MLELATMSVVFLAGTICGDGVFVHDSAVREALRGERRLPAFTLIVAVACIPCILMAALWGFLSLPWWWVVASMVVTIVLAGQFGPLLRRHAVPCGVACVLLTAVLIGSAPWLS